MSTEYDVAHSRQIGNFPQAFSHLALIAAAEDVSAAAEATRGAPDRAAALGGR